MNVIFTYLPLIDISGNRLHKRHILERYSHWFEVIKPFDISFINKDWLKTSHFNYPPFYYREQYTIKEINKINNNN